MKMFLRHSVDHRFPTGIKKLHCHKSNVLTTMSVTIRSTVENDDQLSFLLAEKVQFSYDTDTILSTLCPQ
jgi:hypothetical protein